MILAKVDFCPDSNLLDQYTSFDDSPSAQFESDTKEHNAIQLSEANNQLPQTSSLSEDAFIHLVYMREDDVSRLIQSGLIIVTDGRLQYEHKLNDQTEIF